MRKISQRNLVSVLALVVVLGLSACGRTHTTGRSDEKADGKPLLYTENGANSKEIESKNAQPTKGGTDPQTGTDSTGRPGGPSGGTSGAGAGSGTSGTVTGDPGRKP